MAEQVIALTASEIDALHGVGPLAFTVYVLLRQWMDYGTGTVGRTRPVSLAMIRAYTETHTPRGYGTQIEQASEKAIRCALDRLIRAHLLQRQRAETLVFKLPMALTAPARPNQTGHDGGTNISTKQGTAKPAPAMAMRPEQGTAEAAFFASMRAHIMHQENLKPYAPPVDNFVGHGQAPQPRKTRSPDGSPSNRPSHPAPRLRPTIPGTSTIPSISHQDSLKRLGQRIGVEARPGESWQEYGHRLFRHIEQATSAPA